MKKLLLSIFAFSFGVTGMNAQIFWQEEATGFTAASRGVNQISLPDANSAWVSVYDGITTTNTIQEFAVSADAGTTWTPGVINIGNATLGISCIAGTSATTAYVGAAFSAGGAGGGIWKTTNSGTTWTKQPTALYSSTASFTDVVYFWDANTGMTLGDPDTPTTFEIYTTTNGGTNWNRVPAGNVPVPLDGEFGYTRQLTVTGDAIWCGTNKGRIYRSYDKGTTWTVYVSPVADFQTANMAFQDNNNGVLITDDWQFFRTTNGGETWVSEFPAGTYRNGSIAFVPGTCSYVSLGDDIDLGERGSSYSTDAGLNWIDINLLGDDVNNDNGTDVAFYSNAYGLSSGFNTSAAVGGIFKYVGAPTTLDCSIMATTSYTAAKNFIATPNPTSGAMQLVGKNISNVTVYDVLGKQVANYNYSALSNVSLDLSSYNNGVYMVKVTNASGSSETIKVVKQ